MNNLDALYSRPEQEPFERFNALLVWGQQKLQQPKKTRRVIPGDAFDSQLHFIVTSCKNGLCTRKDANIAIKKLMAERRGKYGNRYAF